MDANRKRQWDVGFGIVTPIVTVAGILIGVWQFEAGEHNKVELEYRLTSKKDELEFKRRLWLERLTIYRAVADQAGKIAAAPDARTLEKAATEFAAIYWGSMLLVEDRDVEQAMINLNLEVSDFKAGWSSRSRLKWRAGALGTACRKSIVSGMSVQ